MVAVKSPVVAEVSLLVKLATVPWNGTPVVAVRLTPLALSTYPSGGENSEVVPEASVAVAVSIGWPVNGM